MKAIVQDAYGPPSVLALREVDPPEVGDEDVLVRVRAASLHPDVWHCVTGRPYVLRVMGSGLLKPKNPIPGTDMAGVIESVGGSVTKFRPGDAVFGETYTDNQWTNGGAFAEYVSVREEWVARKPDNVSFEQAASVPSSGFIALHNLRGAQQMLPGKRMLINGAGGGVGTIALQFAKACGARHVTAVDTTSKLDLLRSLGADEVIDFTQEDFTRRGERWDVIFDVPGNRPFATFTPALEPSGRYVPIGHQHYGATRWRVFGLIPHFVMLMLRARFDERLRGPAVPPPNRVETLAVLRELLESGKLTPPIDSTYPLGEVREAFRHMTDEEALGKVILTVP